MINTIKSIIFFIFTLLFDILFYLNYMLRYILFHFCKRNLASKTFTKSSRDRNDPRCMQDQILPTIFAV